VTPLGQDVDELQSTRPNTFGAKPLPLIALENVSLGYASTSVLRQINLEIYPGELVGLAGPNGSGKTTLFRAILGLLPIVDGSLTRGCPLSNFGYVPQSASLDPQFPLSVTEIVEMGAYGRVRPYEPFSSIEKTRAKQVLEQVGMAHVKRHSFFSLSGGQKQRILIARALMVQPKIMILDEPLSGVDETTRHSITELLIRLVREQGLGIFFSSHDLAMVQAVADKIVRVENGRVWLEERTALHP
jgi:manganese/iron transport system ATP-binding protein